MTPTPHGAAWSTPRKRLVELLVLLEVAGRAGIQGRCPGRGRPAWGCQSSFAWPVQGMGRFDSTVGRVNQTGDHAIADGVMTCATAPTVCVCGSCCQAADVAVA